MEPTENTAPLFRVLKKTISDLTFGSCVPPRPGKLNVISSETIFYKKQSYLNLKKQNRFVDENSLYHNICRNLKLIEN